MLGVGAVVKGRFVEVGEFDGGVTNGGVTKGGVSRGGTTSGGADEMATGWSAAIAF